MQSKISVDHEYITGLPDGVFSYQKYHFSVFWKALGWKTFIISWQFGIFVAILVYFVAIWYFEPRKNLATLVRKPLTNI
jgi:hypothetical protein